MFESSIYLLLTDIGAKSFSLSMMIEFKLNFYLEPIQAIIEGITLKSTSFSVSEITETYIFVR